MSTTLPLPQLHLHHFSIAVDDIAESIVWYRDVFGMELERESELASPEITGRNAFLVRDGLRVELWSVKGAVPVPAERRAPNTDLLTGGTKHIAFEVNGLQAVVDALVERGVDIATVQRSPTAPHLPEDDPRMDAAGTKAPVFAAFIRDPSGTLIELYDPAQRASEASGGMRGE